MLKTVMQYFAGGILAGALMIVAMDYMFAMPDVYVSYTTNECKTVATYEGIFFGGGDYSCGDLPSKYNHVWVE